MGPTSLDVSTLFCHKAPAISSALWMASSGLRSSPLRARPSGLENRASVRTHATVRPVITDMNRLPSSDSQYSLDEAARPHENASMEVLHLRRIDPDRNMARFYNLTIEPTLFGTASLVREWGRIGTFGETGNFSGVNAATIC
ncbi:WGR domain-containing protein [Allomesorhizobium camelthorni]